MCKIVTYNPSVRGLKVKAENAIEFVEQVASVKAVIYTPMGDRCKYCGAFVPRFMGSTGKLEHAEDCIWVKARRLLGL